MKIPDSKYNLGDKVKLKGSDHYGIVMSKRYDTTYTGANWQYWVALSYSGGMGNWMEADCEKISVTSKL